MQNVERDITNLSLAREASEDSLSEAVSLYSSKDTLSASETWLRSRAIAQYVPEPSPKSPLVSCHLNSPNKDSFKERDISSKADESESSTDRSILGKDLNQNMPEEQSTTHWKKVYLFLIPPPAHTHIKKKCGGREKEAAKQQSSSLLLSFLRRNPLIGERRDRSSIRHQTRKGRIDHIPLLRLLPLKEEHTPWRLSREVVV